MKAETREILADTMVRNWGQVYNAEDYRFTGTAAAFVADFTRRTGVEIRNAKLVMDDGEWEIRGTLPTGGIATLASEIQ